MYKTVKKIFFLISISGLIFASDNVKYDQEAREENNIQLVKCAAKGDVGAVEQILLSKNVDVDAFGFDGKTALMYAARRNNKKLAELLLNHKAKIDLADADGYTALMWAANKGHAKMVTLLLGRGATIGLKNKDGLTALDLAAIFDNEKAFKVLTENGAELNILSTNDKKDESVKKSDQKSIKKYIYRRETLSKAITKNDSDKVRELLSNGVDVDTKLSDGDTGLILATRLGRVDISGLLIAFGANVKAEDDKFKNTALHIAAENGNEEISKLLLGKGAKIDAVNFVGATPLHFAIWERRENLVRLFLSKAKINKFEKGLLNDAIATGKKNLVKLLLENSARLDIKDYNDQAPLHLAIKNKYKDIAELLLENEIDINATDKNGATPLYLAAKDLSMVNLLIGYGVNLNEYHALFTINEILRELWEKWSPVIKDFYQDKSSDCQFIDFRKNIHKKTDVLSENHKNILNTLNKYVASDLSKIILIDYFIGNDSNLLFKYWIHTSRPSLISEYNSLLGKVQSKDSVMGAKSSTDQLNLTDAEIAFIYADTSKNSSSQKSESDKFSHNYDEKHGGQAYSSSSSSSLSSSSSSSNRFKNNQALIAAAKCEHDWDYNFDKAKKILDTKEVNVDASDEEYNTPLHYAVKNDNEKLVELLLKNGAKADSVNLVKDTPLEIALRYSYTKIVELLLNYDAGVNQKKSTSSSK